jgi:hypothetical protein
MWKKSTFLAGALAAGIFLSFSHEMAEAAEGLSSDMAIEINIPSRTLCLYKDGGLVKKYSVGIGRPDSQTPLGDFKIRYKEKNPTWVSPADETKQVASGPENPLGYRWMEIAGVYGIHGTNNPSSIGGYVSNGCIRMYEADVEELYDIVPLETPVTIEYERVRVEKTDDNSVYLTVYGDGYMKQSVTAGDLRNEIAKCDAKANEVVSDARLAEIIGAASDSRVKLAQFYPVYVMGKLLDESGIVISGKYYVPVAAAAEVMDEEIGWNYYTSSVNGINGDAPAIVVNGKVYVDSEYSHTVFNAYANWQGSREKLMLDDFKY